MRRLGRSGLEVSALALGAMNFGMPGWGCDEDEAQRILAVYSDAGGNFLDTANIYAGGDSERILGRPVAGRRSEFVIASKVGLTLPGQSSGLAPRRDSCSAARDAGPTRDRLPRPAADSRLDTRTSERQFSPPGASLNTPTRRRES